MTMDDNNIFGPGTDMVVSLCAILLLSIVFITKDYSIISNFFEYHVFASEHDIEVLNSKYDNLQNQLLEVSKINQELINRNNELIDDNSYLNNRNRDLTQQVEELSNKYQNLLISNEDLERKYLNTLVPKRSKIGKNIVRVKMEIRNKRKYYYISKIDENPIRIVSINELHKQLKKYKKIYGDRLYVQVLHSDNLKYRDFWQFTKKMLRYDYYKLSDWL